MCSSSYDIYMYIYMHIRFTYIIICTSGLQVHWTSTCQTWVWLTELCAGSHIFIKTSQLHNNHHQGNHSQAGFHGYQTKLNQYHTKISASVILIESMYDKLFNIPRQKCEAAMVIVVCLSLRKRSGVSSDLRWFFDSYDAYSHHWQGGWVRIVFRFRRLSYHIIAITATELVLKSKAQICRIKRV